MQVRAAGTVVLEVDDDRAIPIEGNQYVPKDGLTADARLEPSPTPYHCPWKGDASYWNLVVGDATIEDAAWSYEQPMDSAVERVGQDFAGYVAFDRSKVDLG
ncbi:MAG: DUF427 domain-containing protein [Acidimicrobiia bacterium]